MNLALKIQKHRRERGLTQEELAEALNVSHQSISKWESAQTLPGLDKVLLISEYFQVSTDYLLKDEVEPGASPGTSPDFSPVPSPVPLSAVSLAQTRQPPPKGRPGFLFYLGAFVAAAGCAGLLLLWILSLLHPPYTLGKTLGPIEMFFFYIRYNEIETLLTLAVVASLAGLGILLLYRFRWLILSRGRTRHADHRLSQARQNTPAFSEPEDP